jgi:hypothetical protein
LLVDEGAERFGYVDRAQRSEPECPAAVELLLEAVRDALACQICFVALGSGVSAGALEGGVKAVASVVDRPDREAVWYRPGVDRDQLVVTHASRIGAAQTLGDSRFWIVRG